MSARICPPLASPPRFSPQEAAALVATWYRVVESDESTIAYIPEWYRVAESNGSTIAYIPDRATAQTLCAALNHLVAAS